MKAHIQQHLTGGINLYNFKTNKQPYLNQEQYSYYNNQYHSARKEHNITTEKISFTHYHPEIHTHKQIEKK
ncbi:hypothetical protein BK663_02840 [Pseudomonas lini]|uniref:Uncharacterized protein n=1 Tax=Pseudomonas lini TaxID=163011 RepID=A0A423IXT2_9PSED|nr:hypothetical protein BK663_02840 [Pseudomonas lini]